MKLKVIITGATGLVGEGVLLECLQHPDVEKVLIVNRKPTEIKHAKLQELLVPDFLKLEVNTEALKGYNACFYCAGISSVGVEEDEYSRITYDTTLHFAKVMVELNPDMVFNFVSGRQTDSSESGKLMWARVKGKTENALGRLPFKKQYNFRPGFMKPTPGQKNVSFIYKLLGGIFPLILPAQSSTMREVGLAMINAVLKGYSKQTLEVGDIKRLAKGE